jgi:hypothetical protein
MSILKVIETVPKRFVRRLGDQALEGSNNTLIILGTDRAKRGPATVDDGLGTVNKGGKGTGTIHLVAGRNDPEGNPDFDNDKSFIYISMRTMVDENLGLSMGTPRSDASGIIMKSDNIRLVAKSGDVKISMDGGKNYIILDEGKCLLQIGETSIEVTGDDVSVKCKNLKADASTSAKIVSPIITLDGEVTVTKSLTVAAAVSAASVTAGTVAGTSTVTAAGKDFGTHTHPVPGITAGSASTRSGPPA